MYIGGIGDRSHKAYDRTTDDNSRPLKLIYKLILISCNLDDNLVLS